MSGGDIVRLAAEPWFPGVTPPSADDRFAPRPFTPADADRRWYLDFHYLAGVVPLGIGLVHDIIVASQLAARVWRSAPTGGLAGRFVGPHVYVGPAEADESTPAHLEAVRRALAAYPARFRTTWGSNARRIEAALRHLESVELPRLDRAELARYLRRARHTHREAWQIHFAVMYPVLAVHAAYLAECEAVGVTPATATTLLRGQDTHIAATDRGLSTLARTAEAAGLADLVRDAPAGEAFAALGRHPAGARWLGAFHGFVARFGHRGGGLADLTTPSWVEDPATPLALIRRALLDGADASGSRAATVDLPDLTPAERRRLDGALGRARVVNAVWWNEEHNFFIDLRAHLPVRAAALAAGRLLAVEPVEHVLYLLDDELDALLAGRARFRDFAALAAQRAGYMANWRARRHRLPRVVGGAGSGVEDPVLDEIYGTETPSCPPAGPAPVLQGLGVSPGIGCGPARLVRSVAELADVEPGCVVVCEATSPAWTPIFPRLAACVCDEGGMLTHAAIASRECGLPCVCAVGTATTSIHDGDLVEVDGSAGTVTIRRPVR